MKNKELDGILAFMLRADELKEVDRTGWTIAKVDKHENVGDHSYSTALLSYLVADSVGLDAERCAMMGLVHDINEILTTDIATRYDKRLQTIAPNLKRKMERLNELKLIRALGNSGKSQMRSLLDEYYKQQTKEAKLVKQLDKLDYIIQISHYSSKIKDNERIEEFFKTADKAINIPEVRYIYDKIRAKIFKERGIDLE
jgi:putative hydrolase of HD superfamily